tara:strand:- start:552 stop:1310 length:759 start_codon:yes stop_codon:yes gene_type:complete
MVNKKQSMHVHHFSSANVVQTVKEFGAALVPNFLNKSVTQGLEIEVDTFFSNLKAQDEACFINSSMSITSDSYKAGKVMRIDRSSYSIFPEIYKNLVNNAFLKEIVDSYYGTPNNSFMQTFCTHEFIPRNKEWIDGINHNAGLHFDPYQALKFIVFITDAAKKNGAMRLIPKSNLEGKKFRENLKPTYYKGESILDCHTPFSNGNFDESDAVHMEGTAGSLLVFDTDLWHGGGEILQTGLERKYIICHNRKR